MIPLPPARAIGVIVLAVVLAGSARAQFDGPRVYWPLPKNTNVVAVRGVNGTANAAWSNWTRVEPTVDLETEMFLLSYTRVQPVFGRTAYWQAILPMATLDTSSSLPAGAADSFADGLGDPSFMVTVNLFGKPEMMAKEYLRHDQEFSLDLGLMVSAPLGTYDENESLNVGSNQWRGRLSLPIVQSIGPWVPGRRTTLELNPAIHVFGDNDESLGNRIEQDVLFSLEAHLTRDLTRESYLSLDYAWLEGGEESRFSLGTGTLVRETDGLDAQLLGFTFGFEINDSTQLVISHAQTVSGSAGGSALDGSLTTLTVALNWHSVLEGVRQFRKE